MGTSVRQTRTTGKRHKPPARNAALASPIDKAKPQQVIWQQVAPLFEAARILANPSFVYFIGEPDNGPVKIGVAKDPIARVRGMQTGNPRRLRIEHVLIGDRDTEQLLHEMWESDRLTAEWFTPEIRERLLPVVARAAEKQIAFLTQTTGDLELVDLERLIRQAHGEFDIVARPRDVVRKLAAGSGYVVTGRTRI